ncbi:MAG TPA: helix-turn-helix domain-containing protein [Paenibacillus sp.]|nr:helix-turn-helix domain-containing protein [Paenibacillus sp.]
MSLREKKKEETKAKLLAAARSAFEARGYGAAKTSDIAKEVGIAEGTLFNYFPTKAELFLAAMLPSPEAPSQPPAKAESSVASDAAGWAEAAVAVVDERLRGLAGMAKGLQREFVALGYAGGAAEATGLAAFDSGIADAIGALFAEELRAREPAAAELATECACGLALACYSAYIMEDAMTYDAMLSRLRRQLEFALKGHG